jgi:hypothetical protein
MWLYILKEVDFFDGHVNSEKFQSGSISLLEEGKNHG